MILGECFLIMPIGTENSEIRKHADQVRKHLIDPAIEGFYKSKMPHELPEVGNIPMQVIKHIATAPLLIADLTNHNPNVYYELAVRHAVSLPAILIIQHDQLKDIPFDLKSLRTIPYNLTDLDSAVVSKEKLRTWIKRIAENPAAQFDDIISDTITLMQIPENHRNKVFLGTLMIASIVRFDLIDNFLNKPFEEVQERYANLQKSYSRVLRISAHESYLEPQIIKDAICPNDPNAQGIIDNLFVEAHNIVTELGPAITTKDETKIQSLLNRWKINNNTYFCICLEAYKNWIDSDSKPDSS